MHYTVYNKCLQNICNTSSNALSFTWAFLKKITENILDAITDILHHPDKIGDSHKYALGALLNFVLIGHKPGCKYAGRVLHLK